MTKTWSIHGASMEHRCMKIGVAMAVFWVWNMTKNWCVLLFQITFIKLKRQCKSAGWFVAWVGYWLEHNVLSSSNRWWCLKCNVSINWAHFVWMQRLFEILHFARGVGINWTRVLIFRLLTLNKPQFLKSQHPKHLLTCSYFISLFFDC